MSRLLKTALIAAAAVSLVIVSLFVATKFLVTPERVRQAIIPVVEKTLQRPVSIGDIDVRLFSGIAFKDFIVRSRDGKTDFISADALILTYRLWPLFQLRVVIDEARLDGPTINVVRSENGEFNFSDLLASEKPAGDRVLDEGRPPEPAGDEPVIAVQINELAITDGKLTFIDRNLDGGPVEYQVENLMVMASDLSPSHAFPVSIDCLINSSRFALDGTIDPQLQSFDLKFSLQDFDFSTVMPYMAGSFPGRIESMRLDLKGLASGDMIAVRTSGQVDASRVDLLLDAMPEAPLKDAGASVVYDLSVNTDLQRLSIHRADAVFNGVPLFLSGYVENYASAPNLDIDAALPMIPLETLITAAPKALADPVAAMKPEGQVAADIQLFGSIDDIESIVQKGRITLDAVRFSTGDLPVRIDGRIDLEKDTVSSEELNLRFDDSPAVLEFTATNIMGTPIRASHNLHARALNLDEILNRAGGGQKMPAEDEKPVPSPSKIDSKPKPSGPIDLPLILDGRVRVNNAVYRGLAINDFELLYHLENNLLKVSQIRGEVAGGTISGTGQADLNEEFITYTTDMSINGTQTNSIISSIYPRAADTLFGNLFLNMKLNGKGIDPNAISQALTGTADLRITDGRLTGTGLTRGLAAFLDAEKLEVLRFNSVAGDVRLANGKIEIDSSRYMGSDMRMSPSGTIGLDGTIDLSLNLQVAPELAERINGNKLISQLLSDRQGWALIPLNVTGSLTSPRFSLDMKIMRQLLQEKASQELRQQIREKLFKQDTKEEPPKSDEKTAPKEDKAQPSLDQIIEEGLKKLIK